jgi:predicted MPP superfamily phosphohydrolase
MCEGNHDLIQDRLIFEHDVKRSGIPLLLNESMTIDVRNHPIQLLGIKWGGRSGFDPATNAHVANTLRLRDQNAFPILLAHHPHAFDPAAEANIPLTLAGHTHGGQIMLTKNFGPGPLMYKYWSGLYHKDQSQLVVSNGVGNWFPLRINAPAEILHLTLRPA